VSDSREGREGEGRVERIGINDDLVLTLDRDWLAERVERVPFHECWEWTGGSDRRGYGMIQVNRDGRFTNLRAHRAMYILEFGAIPPGRVLDHLCRRPSCVRPTHLEAVSDRVNILRGIGNSAENARKTHCQRGHHYDETNTYWIGRKRYCRLCRQITRSNRDRAYENRLERERKRRIREQIHPAPCPATTRREMMGDDFDRCECGHIRDEHEDGRGQCLAMRKDESCGCVHFDFDPGF
jgi:hypothetical protein